MEKEIATIEFNISKLEFIEKLKLITLEYSIDSVNQIHRRDPGKWMKRAVKQDYNELNKQFALEQDIFNDLQIPETKIFEGEIKDTEINLFIIAKKLFSKDPKNFINNEKLAALILKLQNNLDLNDNKLFYYRIDIEDLDGKIKVNIYKHKFKYIYDRLQSTHVQIFRRGYLSSRLICEYYPPLLFLALAYFIEELFYKSHNFFNMIAAQVLLLTVIWTFIHSGYKLQKEVNKIKAYQKDLDDVFILLLQKAITV